MTFLFCDIAVSRKRLYASSSETLLVRINNRQRAITIRFHDGYFQILCHSAWFAGFRKKRELPFNAFARAQKPSDAN
jgi:hypothetical protein